MRKRRIAVDVTPLLYRRTGIARVTQNLLAGVSELDSDMDLVGFGRRLLGGRSDVGHHGFAYRRLRLPRRAERLIQSLGAIERMCRADLYHATDFYLPLRPSSLAIATVHDLLFLTNPEDSVDHARLAKWVPSFVKRCAAVIAVSHFVKQQIETVLNVDSDSIHVVHPGVDRGVFSPPDDLRALKESLAAAFGLSRPYFLAVSCSAGRKNTPFLLETYIEFLKRNPRHDLVLAWDPPAHIKVAYAPFQKIRFVGHVSDDELRRLYCGATAMIFPSLYEGFGLPVIEAMSCGTPVIASKEASIPEAGGNAALYIDPREPASLVNVLAAFEGGAIAVAELRPKLFEQASRFNWRKSARQTLEVYELALDWASRKPPK